MSDGYVVLVTVPDEATAGRLCRTLLEERLVACGNVVPGVRSLYRWEGRIHDDAEVLLVLKTSSGRVADLVERIPQIHPYEVPEVLALAVEAGYGPYLRWMSDETSEREQDDA